MREKVYFILFLTIVLGLSGITGCNRETKLDNDSGHENETTTDDTADKTIKIVDFRLEDESRSVYSRAAEDYSGEFSIDDLAYETSFPYRVDVNEPELTDDEIKSVINFTATDDGIKIVYTLPERFDDYEINTVQAYYVQTNGSLSTCSSPKEFWKQTEKIKTWNFPFVIPNSCVRFWVQLEWKKDSERKVFQANYALKTKGGMGVVKDLPEDTEEFSRMEVDGSEITINYVEAPDTKQYDTLKKVIALFEAKKDWGCGWGTLEDKSNWIASASLDVENNTFYTVDVSTLDEFISAKINTDYYFYTFSYEYTLDSCENSVFSTPCVLSSCMSGGYIAKSQLEKMIESGKVKKNSATNYEVSTALFTSLRNQLDGTEDGFTFVITDKTPDLESFFLTMCWNDIDKGCKSTFVLDLSKTEVTELPAWKIYDAKKMTGVVLPDTLEIINDGAFAKTSMTSVVIPANVKAIGSAVLPYAESDNGSYSYLGTVEFEDKENWYKTYSDDAWKQKNVQDAYSVTFDESYEIEVWARYLKVEE